jgi:hypothetical protein
MKIEIGKLYNFRQFIVESDNLYPVYSFDNMELIEFIDGYDPFVILEINKADKRLKVLTIKGTIGVVYSSYRFERILDRYYGEEWIHD